MKNKKSAKDIAFDRERDKFRKEINGLKRELEKANKRIDTSIELLKEKDKMIADQREMINKLIVYMELPKEDMEQVLDKDKKAVDLLKKFEELYQLFEILGN